MGTELIVGLDLAIVACAAMSGLFWYLASRRQVRRISPAAGASQSRSSLAEGKNKPSVIASAARSIFDAFRATPVRATTTPLALTAYGFHSAAYRMPHLPVAISQLANR
jgi:hypothetical protein